MSIPSRHSDPEKIASSERTFFVTSSTAGKRFLLQTERSAKLFIEILHHYRAEGKYRLHAFVVMRDHFHVLVTLDFGMTVERAVQLIKGGFAFRAGKEFGLRAPVWQKGFSEVRIFSWPEYEARVKYIHENPVREGYSAAPEAYEFSSASSAYEVDPPPQRLKAIPDARQGGTAQAVP